VVLRLIIPGPGDRPHIVQPGDRAQLFCEFLAVHFWQPDVEQAYVGREGLNASERLFRAISHLDVVTLEHQQHGERIRCIEIVVHHQRAPGLGLEMHRGGNCDCRSRDPRQPDFKG